APTRHPIDAEELDDLTRWATEPRFGAPPLRHLRTFVPARRADTVAAAGLVDAGRLVGLVAVEGSAPLEAHRELLDALIPPLVVALRNDRRVQELARLREAVEAENRALL